MHRTIEGIIPALITTVDEHGRLAPDLQRALIARLLRQGAHGIFVGGSTGEFPLLTIEERESLLETAISEISGQVPVIAHVGAPRLQDSIRLAQHAARQGARAVSAVPPYYFDYTEDAVVDYLREVAGAAGLPFYYYHVPALVPRTLDRALLDRLMEIPEFAGVKYSEPDLARLDELKRHAGSDVRFLCGVDRLVLPSLLLGADGAVGSTYNTLMPIFRQLWAAWRKGDIERSRAAQRQANPLIRVLEGYPIIPAVKELLGLLDLDPGPPRLPLPQLTPEQRVQLAEELYEAGLWKVKGISESQQGLRRGDAQ